ncbi:target of Myb protein 1-like isoform X2 [Thalassophryne amazonica]|uniref:target of Myb protein 1-like isoform X2 n=1 Tax=Thalassophryne amazonica TaxID=390379 RepID=UPI001471F3B5|nr:target of Myb protein 1-like isoform X2 [Thalassophryne amazonica]
MFSFGETMEFLIGNPFSTPVGQRIEQATSGTLQSENWGLNMEICDIINETDEGPKDAVKAIKKRIVGNRNFREIMLALTVLETCVKNCGHRFHVLVASQEFVEGVLVRSILPKYNPPIALHDRVLSLIQSWADAFRSTPSLVGVVYVYDDLRRQGLEFPMTDLDALSPIHTPSRSIPENELPNTTPVTSPPEQSHPQTPPTHPSQNNLPAVQPHEGPGSISAEQEQKLQRELALVKGNLTVMSQMLNELKPGQSQREDTDLLQQLHLVCRSMQTRVVELVPQLMDEAFIAELLAVNDDLNNTFIRYDRFDRLNKAQMTSQQNAATSQTLSDPSPDPLTPSQTAIISASSQSAVSAETNNRQTAEGGEEEEFDMFAQTRSSSLAEQRRRVRYEDPGAVEGLAGALDSRLQITAGMQSDAGRGTPCETEQPAVCEGASGEESEKFLEDQAKPADHSEQTISSPPLSTSRPPLQPTRQYDASHDNLFTL